MMTRLTVHRLRAIEFALGFVLAGDVPETIADVEVTSDDLDAASNWVAEQLLERERASEGDK